MVFKLFKMFIFMHIFKILFNFYWFTYFFHLGLYNILDLLHAYCKLMLVVLTWSRGLFFYAYQFSPWVIVCPNRPFWIFIYYLNFWVVMCRSYRLKCRFVNVSTCIYKFPLGKNCCISNQFWITIFEWLSKCRQRSVFLTNLDQRWGRCSES